MEPLILPMLFLIITSGLIALAFGDSVPPLPGAIIAALALILATTLYVWSWCSGVSEDEDNTGTEMTKPGSQKPSTIQKIFNFFGDDEPEEPMANHKASNNKPSSDKTRSEMNKPGSQKPSTMQKIFNFFGDDEPEEPMANHKTSDSKPSSPKSKNLRKVIDFFEGGNEPEKPEENPKTSTKTKSHNGEDTPSKEGNRKSAENLKQSAPPNDDDDSDDSHGPEKSRTKNKTIKKFQAFFSTKDDSDTSSESESDPKSTKERAGVFLIFRRKSDRIEFLHTSNASWWQGTSTKNGDNLKDVALKQVLEETGLKSEDLKIIDDFSEKTHYKAKDSNSKLKVTYWLAEVTLEAEVTMGCEWKSLEDSLDKVHNDDMADIFKKSAKYIDKNKPEEDQSSVSSRKDSLSNRSISNKSISSISNKSISSISNKSISSISNKSISSISSISNKTKFNKTKSNKTNSKPTKSGSSSDDESTKYEKLSKSTEVAKATFGTWYNDKENHGLCWRVLERKKQTFNIKLTDPVDQEFAPRKHAERDTKSKDTKSRDKTSKPKLNKGKPENKNEEEDSIAWVDYLIIAILILIGIFVAIYFFSPGAAEVIEDTLESTKDASIGLWATIKAKMS